MSLALITAAVREGANWSEIILDCGAVGEFEDRGQRLADRLLGRLRNTLERELSVFAWAGQPVCGQDFLTHLIQPLGIRKVRNHGLTAADRSDVVRLHDVVFAALNPDWCSEIRRRELDAALESYLISAAGETGLQLWTIGRIFAPEAGAACNAGLQAARIPLCTSIGVGSPRTEAGTRRRSGGGRR